MILLDKEQAKMSLKPTIELDDCKIRELWSRGVLNDFGYITLALELHDKPSFDVVQFSRDWSVEDLSENEMAQGWKSKKLKIRSILNAICILEDKGMAICNYGVTVKQLSLF
jgi:hypothetical protein